MGSGRSGAGGGGGGGGVSLGGGGGSGWNGGSGGGKNGTTGNAKGIADDVNRVLSNLSREYLTTQFASPLTRALYELLFDFKEQVINTKSWNNLQAKYGVTGDAGCLRRWARGEIQRLKEQEPDQKVQETASLAFENFLLDALGSKDSVYFSGRSDAVLARLDEKVFNSTSSIFLAHMLRCVLERQATELPDDLQIELFDIAQAKADRIVERFEKKYLGTKFRNRPVTHQDLFVVIEANMPWFIGELRRR